MWHADFLDATTNIQQNKAVIIHLVIPTILIIEQRLESMTLENSIEHLVSCVRLNFTFGRQYLTQWKTVILLSTMFAFEHKLLFTGQRKLFKATSKQQIWYNYIFRWSADHYEKVAPTWFLVEHNFKSK